MSCGALDGAPQILGKLVPPTDDPKPDRDLGPPATGCDRAEGGGRDVGDRGDLVGRPAELLERQRPERHLADAEVGAPVEQLERLLGPGAMPLGRIESTLASGHLTYRQDGDTLLYRYTITQKGGLLDRASYEELRRAIQKMHEAERRPIVLRRTAAATLKSRVTGLSTKAELSIRLRSSTACRRSLFGSRAVMSITPPTARP